MSMTSYERIKNSVVLDFEEYINEDGLNVVQVSAKILEEDLRRVNYSLFTKTLYFVSIAIESLKYSEIPDFIYTKLDSFLENRKFEETIDNNDVEQLLQDIELCKKLIDEQQYIILETSDSTRIGIDYILGLKIN